MEELLTTKQYAELHGVSQRTVQRWLAEGLIYGAKIGRGFKISSDEIPPTNNYSLPPEGLPVEQPPVDPIGPTEGLPEELPEDEFAPEEVDEDAEEDEDCPGVHTADENSFPRRDLRKIYQTCLEALSDAADYAIPTIVFKRASDGRFQIVVDYP